MSASSIEVGGLSPARPAKFSVAANYDPELIPALGAYPVDEVYGKFPTDGVSGGRPRYQAIPEADLRRYIQLWLAGVLRSVVERVASGYAHVIVSADESTAVGNP